MLNEFVIDPIQTDLLADKPSGFHFQPGVLLIARAHLHPQPDVFMVALFQRVLQDFGHVLLFWE